MPLYVCVFVCVVHPQACPPSNGHIRAAQCSSYNQQLFMGRLYKWEPFSDGRLCVCPNTNQSTQSHKPSMITYVCCEVNTPFYPFIRTSRQVKYPGNHQNTWTVVSDGNSSLIQMYIFTDGKITGK